jgi:hypothetical protein
MSHRRLVAAMSLAAGAVLATAAAALPAASSSPGEQQTSARIAPGHATNPLKVQRAHATQRPTPATGPTAAQRALQRYGYLVPHPAAYDRAKAGAARRSVHAAQGVSAPGTSAPVQASNFAGIADTTGSPSDSTGAVGTTRYMELVNSRFGLYNRSNALVGQGTLHSLIGAAAADDVFDPQVIWDPGTSRFYYAADQIRLADGHNLLAIGFSKAAGPNGAAGFCKYTFDYGLADFPDYPKLGDTQNFWVLGVNVFTGNTFTGSDILAITKPAAGSTCPAAASFGVTVKSDVTNADLTPAFTPVPANQTDTAGTGWVVARPATLPASFLTVFKITRSATTGAAVISTGSNVAVPSYDVPANAPQSGATQVIDTSDARNTQAVSAVDPLHANGVGLWTQHTVAGGAGAQVRWYEINPVTKTLFRSGKVTSATLFSFNAAISPDRKVSGTTKAFGGNMVMNFNTSSSSTFPAIKLVSKVGSTAQSAPVTIATSAGPGIDFTCPAVADVCRWGDYAAATPDPAASATAARGIVFGTSQYTKDGRLDPGGVNWLTRNFSFTP